VIARYKRLRGYDTYFLMGNDEHSQNVFKRAAEQGLHPLAYCDQKEAEFRAVWQSLDISFTDFIRTTGAAAPGGGGEDGAGLLRPRRHLRGRRTRAGTACRARPSSRRRISWTASARSTPR
jgi:hypothetical protein